MQPNTNTSLLSLSSAATSVSTTGNLVISAQNLHLHLQQRLQPTHLQVLDESAQHAGHVGSNGTDFGTHFRIKIKSPAFEGKNRVDCHRLVYSAVQNFIDQGLHALAIELLR